MRVKERDGGFLPHGILEQILRRLSSPTLGDSIAFLPRRAFKKRIAVTALQLMRGLSRCFRQPRLAGYADHMDVNALHERNPLLVQLANGGGRNDHTVCTLNKAGERSLVPE
jgi:hypothetical protein